MSAGGAQGKRAGPAAVILLALSLGGCGPSQRGIDPVAWWHNLEGGPIAAQRPPPPDAGAPYPNLATVPARPAPIDPAMRARVSAALAADRADANFEAAQDPLGPAPPKAASGLFAGAAPLSPPPPDTAGAALEATAPPPVAAPAAPTRAAPPPRPAIPPPAAPPATAPPADPPPPVIADVPPPPPHLTGVTIPVTVLHLPPVAPPPPAAREAALTANDRAALSLGFPSGSAVLPAAMLPPLRSLAARRGRHAIAIAGFGESAAADPFSQSDALRLGVARARAVAVALLQDGVPMAALRLQAEAVGAGAAARIVD